MKTLNVIGTCLKIEALQAHSPERANTLKNSLRLDDHDGPRHAIKCEIFRYRNRIPIPVFSKTFDQRELAVTKESASEAAVSEYLEMRIFLKREDLASSTKRSQTPQFLIFERKHESVDLVYFTHKKS